MKIFSKKFLKEWDEFTIQHEPISSLDLMKRASLQLTNRIVELVPPSQKIIVLCGTGNNGGDGLCIANYLRDKFYRVNVWYFHISSPSTDNLICLDVVKKTDEISIHHIDSSTDVLPEVTEDCTFIDALMGYGFSGEWKNGWAQKIGELNQLPHTKIAIDLPSGLSDENMFNTEAIMANYTLTLEVVKRCFYYEENVDIIGRVEVIPIGLHPKYYEQVQTKYHSIDQNYAQSLLRPRGRFNQKWAYGHAALIAGNSNTPGAAFLTAKACLRAGTGLLTCYFPKKVSNSLVQYLPEAMSKPIGDEYLDGSITLPSYITAYGVGPGIGRHEASSKSVLLLLKNTLDIPKVIDADAINMLAECTKDLSDYISQAVLTPHKKEFERLFGIQKNRLSMEKTALEMAAKYNSVVILKGAFSRVCTPEGKIYYNTTGNPGMAKGGCGDVLTGMITGLLAQGYNLEEAAVLGVYLHGLSADIAVKKTGEYSLFASDIIDHIGQAFILTSNHSS
ncbi:MAG: NAD(P)H-hydrate dehydratase [Saprospiraceae bacterium]